MAVKEKKQPSINNLKLVKFEGTTLLVSELPWDVPVVSFTVTEDGECCGFWWSPRWRDNLIVMQAMAGAVKQAVQDGLKPKSGFVYGYTHPDNVKVLELVNKLGLPMEDAEKDGQIWKRWFISVEQLKMEVK